MKSLALQKVVRLQMRVGVALLKNTYLTQFSVVSLKPFIAYTMPRFFVNYGHNDLQSKLFYVIESYQHNRFQCLDVSGVKSSRLPLHLGVRQGSILSLFLFLVYINYVTFFLKSICDVALFVNDTSLTFKIDKKKQEFDDVNSAIQWLLNGLSKHKHKLFPFHRLRYVQNSFGHSAST